MTKGMIFDPASGTLKFLDGTREVVSNERKMVNFLPSSEDYVNTINVTFPDFTKDYLYNWVHIHSYNSLAGIDGQVAQDSYCNTQLTIPAQEWSNTTILDSVPGGADIFIAFIRINRTSSPSHSWGGSPIDTLPVVNQWMPFNGSMLVEAELGMSRAFSIYVSGSNLVLHRQQSVSTPPGGYGSWGTGYDWVSPSSGSGGSNLYGSSPGIPVVDIETVNVTPVIYTSPRSPTVPSADARTYPGGTNACSTSISTNFLSNYRVEIVGKYGRRS